MSEDVTVNLRITFTNRVFSGALTPQEHALGVARALSELYEAKVELLENDGFGYLMPVAVEQ